MIKYDNMVELRKHLEDIASQPHQDPQYEKVESLMGAYKLGERRGRKDQTIDYARFLLEKFF